MLNRVFKVEITLTSILLVASYVRTSARVLFCYTQKIGIFLTALIELMKGSRIFITTTIIKKGLIIDVKDGNDSSTSRSYQLVAS